MNYCPAWLYDFIVGQTAADFLVNSLPIEAFAKKYASALSETYTEIDPEAVALGATAILEFLNEIKAGEDALDLLIQFCWFTLNYENHRGVKRKRKSLLATCFDPEKEINYNSDQSVKAFKAYVYADRSNVLPKMPVGWKISDEQDADLLVKMVDKETSVIDLL